jgi:hypothetical protein
MKSRKELADILAKGMEGGDVDMIWYVVGELESGEEGSCDSCNDSYELGSREGRCGDCGNCGNCCTHTKGAKE